MVFNGRNLDTFESALLMLNDGIPLHRHLDCISGRSFFLDGENRDSLYSCTLTLEDVVRNLNESLGKVFAITNSEGTDDRFVMEFNDDIGMPAIFRKTYPFGHFVFCCRRESMIYVNDPDGFPMLSYPTLDFPLKPQVIVKTGVKITADRNAILKKLKKFISLHKSVTITDLPNRIFMQYAVRNYVCQTNKIMECLCEYIDMPEMTHRKIIQLFGEMLSASPYSADKMNCIDRNIYCLLEELLCAWI